MAKLQEAVTSFIDKYIWSGTKANIDESRVLDVIVDSWTQQYGIDKPVDIANFGKVYQANETVYTCVKVIAEASNDISLKTYEQKTLKGKRQWVVVDNPENPIVKLFSQVNGYTTENEFKEQSLSTLELQGNAYWWIVRNGLGIPVNLYYMRPDYVTIIPDPNVKGGVKAYEFGKGNKKEIFNAEDILHFKYFNPTSQFYGQSPLEAAKVTIEADIYAKIYNKQFYVNSARPYGMLKSKVNLDPDKRKLLKEQWNMSHQGANKAYRTALLEGDLEYTQLGISQTDSDFIQQMKMYREVLMAIFKVPPAMMDVYEYANYANAEAQRKIFWTDVMTKKLNKLSGYINEFLVNPVWGVKYKVAFDYSEVEVLKEAENDKIERYYKAIASGMMSPEKAMELMGWSDDKGTRYIPFNWVAVGSTPPSKDLKKKSLTTDIAKNLNSTRERGISQIRSKYKNALSDMFVEQGEKLVKAITKEINKNKSKQVLDPPKIDIEVVWTEGKFGQMITEVSAMFMSQFIEQGVDTARNLTGINTAFGVDHPVLQGADEQILALLRDRTSLASKADLHKIVTDAIEGNTTVDQMTRDIRRKVSDKWGDFAKYRAERIARTEASGAYGRGSHEYYKEVGIKKHIWYTMKDENVSDICIGNEAQGAIPIDKAFRSGAMHEPGHINCRCSVVPVSEG